MQTQLRIIAVLAVSLLIWSPLSSSAVMIASPDFSVQETWDNGFVEFTVSVPDGWYLAGFGVLNNDAIDAWMNEESFYGTAGQDIWLSYVVEYGEGATSMGTTGWRYPSSWGENGIEEYTALDFMRDMPGNSGDKGFAYFYNPALGLPDMDENELSGSYFPGGTYSGFMGETDNPGSPFAAALYSPTLGGYTTVQGVTNEPASPHATPIPGAVYLLGTGIIGLAGVSRRNKKARQN